MRYLLVIFTILLMPLTVLSAAEERPRSISVSGEAQVRVAPDQVIISMTVMNKEKTLEAAKNANDKTVKSFINYATKD